MESSAARRFRRASWILVIGSILAWWLPVSEFAQGPAPVQTPVVPNASPQARALLHFLQTQRGQHILSGQVEDTENVIWNNDGHGGKEIPFIHRIAGTNHEAEVATALGGVTLVTYNNAGFTGWGRADYGSNLPSRSREDDELGQAPPDARPDQ